MARFALVALIALAAVGCGGKDEAPQMPSTATYSITASGVECSGSVARYEFGTSTSQGPGPDTIMCDWACTATEPAARVVFEGSFTKGGWQVARWFDLDYCP